MKKKINFPILILSVIALFIAFVLYSGYGVIVANLKSKEIQNYHQYKPFRYEYMLYGKDKKPLSDEKFDSINNFSDLYLVTKNKKYGVVDKTGKLIIPVIYQNITMLNGFIKAHYSDRQTSYDVIYDKKGNKKLTGRFITNTITVYNNRINNSLCFVQNDNGTYTVLDDNFQRIQSLTFEEIPITVSNKYLIFKNEKTAKVIDFSKKIVIPPYIYENIEATFSQDGKEYFFVMKDKKRGMIDTKNNIILPIVFDTIGVWNADKDLPEFIFAQIVNKEAETTKFACFDTNGKYIKQENIPDRYYQISNQTTRAIRRTHGKQIGIGTRRTTTNPVRYIVPVENGIESEKYPEYISEEELKDLGYEK